MDPRPISEARSCNGPADANQEQEELQYMRSMYDSAKLNKDQKKIFNHMKSHPNSMITVQGGTGTGKTFTLLSIACAWQAPVVVTIFKHDLLVPFKHVADTYTLTSFFMQLFSLPYEEYISLEWELSKDRTNDELYTKISKLFERVKAYNFLHKFKDSLLIVDECTTVPNPQLILLLTLLKSYNIGTIICGDRYQLQSTHNAPQAKYSALHIASNIADKTFNLEINERCSNNVYNEIIKYVSEFSSDRHLDDFGFSILAGLFPYKLCGSSEFSDIHLAATNQELTDLAKYMVMKENIPFSLYCEGTNPSADKNDKLSMPVIDANDLNKLIRNKFLPYLPLKIGTTYFVEKHSEFSLAKLLEFDECKKTVTLRYTNREVCKLKKNDNDDAIFKAHLHYIQNSSSSKIYNYPIYPANFMSLYKCQAYTLNDNLDLHMKEASYRGLYVALSRARDPEQIVRIIISNGFSYLSDTTRHLVSSLINFPEHACEQKITADLLRERMANYVMYDLRDPLEYQDILLRFFYLKKEGCVAEKCAIRDELIRMVANERRKNLQPPNIESDYDETALRTVLDYCRTLNFKY